MLSQLIFYEFRMKSPNATEEDWSTYSKSINVGRELLNRKFIKVFGSPVTINRNIRKALIQTMLQFEKTLPQHKGPNFDVALKQLVAEDLEA